MLVNCLHRLSEVVSEPPGVQLASTVSAILDSLELDGELKLLSQKLLFSKTQH